VTAYNGLFFVGLPWLHDGKSGLIYGVGGDAAYVVQRITSPGRLRIAGQIETRRAIGTRRGCIADQNPNYATFGIASSSMRDVTFEKSGPNPSAMVGCVQS
jgi:hypothetical protein